MDENYQDKTKSKVITTEDVTWGVNRKSKLWVPKHKKRTGFEEKTLWDMLNLFGTLAIPLIIALATIGFGWWQQHLADTQHQNDLKIAATRYAEDKQLAQEQQVETNLQTYLDKMSELFLNPNLHNRGQLGDNVRILATAKTLTMLQDLDEPRRAIVLKFLQNAGLITRQEKNHPEIVNPVVNLNGADFSGVDLGDFDLGGADLAFINFKGASLKNAHLGSAYLAGADLTGADLTGADLSFAQLFNQQPNQPPEIANLTGAHLTGADLTRANFIQANLTNAVLTGATVTSTDFTHVTWKNTTCPNGKNSDKNNPSSCNFG